MLCSEIISCNYSVIFNLRYLIKQQRIISQIIIFYNKDILCCKSYIKSQFYVLTSSILTEENVKSFK